LICERTSIDEAYVDITALARGLVETWTGASCAMESAAATETDLLTGTHVVGMEQPAAVDWIHTVARDDETTVNGNHTNDRLLLAGAIVAARLRQTIRDTLSYTLSAGIAHNKMLAKHASGMHKPFQQTVVRTEAVPDLMARTTIGQLNGFGGKKGTELEEQHGVRFVSDLQRFSLLQLQRIFGAFKFAQTTHDACRGICHEEVKQKVILDSVGNSKTFNPPLNSKKDAHKFIALLSEEVFGRLEVIDSKYKRRAMKITVSISRGKELVMRKGVEVSVAGGKNNVASKSAAMSKWEHKQPGLVKLANALIEPLLDFATFKEGEGGRGGGLTITSLGLIASELEPIPNQASMITGYLQKKRKCANVSNTDSASKVLVGGTDNGKDGAAERNTKVQDSISTINTKISSKKIKPVNSSRLEDQWSASAVASATLRIASPGTPVTIKKSHRDSNNFIGVVDAKDIDLAVLRELPVDMRATIEQQIRLADACCNNSNSNNHDHNNTPRRTQSSPGHRKRKISGFGNLSSVAEGARHSSVSSFLRPVTVSPSHKGTSNDTGIATLAAAFTNNSRDEDSTGNTAAAPPDLKFGAVSEILATVAVAATKMATGWTCKSCTSVNPPIFLTCEICQSLKNC